MKKCPACQAIYNDDNLTNCANCGAELISEIITEQPQEPQQPTPPPVAPQYNSYNNANNAQPCKYCTRCGNPCDPKAVICVRCGTPFGNTYTKIPSADDKPSGGLKFLCFLIPIVGLILFLVNMNDKPVSAKAYGKSALIGFILGIVLYVLFIVLSFIVPFFFYTFDPGVTYYDSGILYSGICNLL
ncbi:MAG: hypothetical protein IKV25_07725 [Clostridia bacterium]|nr:hypothetical protein [Clostridia bacterium]